MKKKTSIFIMLYLFCIGFSISGTPINTHLSLSSEVYGLSNYEVLGLGIKKYINDNFGFQLFLSPKYFAPSFIDCGIGASPILNIITLEPNKKNPDQKLIFQVQFEFFYNIKGNIAEALFDHSFSFILSIGFEFFITKSISLGYRIGYGFLFNYWEYNEDLNFKLDFKYPGNVHPILFYLPISLYL